MKKRITRLTLIFMALIYIFALAGCEWAPLYKPENAYNPHANHHSSNHGGGNGTGGGGNGGGGTGGGGNGGGTGGGGNGGGSGGGNGGGSGGNTPTNIEIPMISITGGTVSNDTGSRGFNNASAEPVTISSFKIAETELTYAKWYEVYQWATSDDRGENKYTFANQGREENNGLVGAAPSVLGNNTPVVLISWRDAVVWCNAASEKENKIPVYWLEGTTDYSDLSRVLRDAQSDSVENGLGKAERAVIREDSLGYRLPTQTEWEFAARGGNPDSSEWDYQWPGTDDTPSVSDYAVYDQSSGNSLTTVKSKSPNSAGIYDMSGSVWEYCQEAFIVSDSAFPKRHARGGSWLQDRPDDVTIDSIMILSADLATDSVGFRVARSVSDNSGSNPGGNPGGGGTGGYWDDYENYTLTDLPITMRSIAGRTVRVDADPHAFLNASSSPVTIAPFKIAETELTYAKWFEVCYWATREERGSQKYTFANPGCEGYGNTPAEPCYQNTPVTGVSLRDAVVWCNAASEKDGLVPVYYYQGTTNFSDSSKVLRTALTNEDGDGYAENAVVRPDADGYRLPGAEEWEFAALGGNPDSPAWGYRWAGTDNESELSDYAVYNNENYSSYLEVQRKFPNTAGLYDMSGNVQEWCFTPYVAGTFYVHSGFYSDTTSFDIRNSSAVGYEPSASSGYGFRVAQKDFSGLPSGSLDITLVPITGTTVDLSTGYGAFGNAPVTVSSFAIAQTELKYSTWYTVYQWASSAARGTRRYKFANPGSEGDGAEGAAPSGNSKPVVNISWRDAVVWCNAASEYEGLTPVYYLEGTTDFSDSTKVLRHAELPEQTADTDENTVAEGQGKAEKAVINPNADGYRLPTITEWEFAGRGGNPDTSEWNFQYAGTDDDNSLGRYAVYQNNSGNTIAPVATKTVNACGLYDMTGNVFEWCWNGNAAETEKPYCGGSYVMQLEYNVLGMSFTTGLTTCNDDRGFRVIRSSASHAGTAAGPGRGRPASQGPLSLSMVTLTGGTVNQIPADVASESDDIYRGAFKDAASNPVTVDTFQIATSELTYEKWRQVYEWAIGSGYYDFVITYMGYDLDLGKLGGYDSYEYTGPDLTDSNQPVTYVSWRDAVVWCNAASEYEGLTPVYWLEGTTDFSDYDNVVRIAEYSNVPGGEGVADKIVVNESADGYRLPTNAEWEYAARGGNTYLVDAWGMRYAGTEVADLSGYAVYGQSTELGATSVAGSLGANAAGIYDMTGNVSEWIYDFFPYRDLSDDNEAWIHSVRGGNYRSDTDECRISYMDGKWPATRNSATGFRVARNAISTAATTPLGLKMRTVKGADVTIAPGNGNPENPFAGAAAINPVTVNSFYIAETETSLPTWLSVKDWAYQHEGLYTFSFEGYEPSSWNETPTPGHSYPVLVNNYCEAIVWCNAASEMEGLTPVYYLPGTTEFTSDDVLRAPDNADIAVIDLSANGYRLPTAAEWEFAARGGSPSSDADSPWNWNWSFTNTESEAMASVTFGTDPVDVDSGEENILHLKNMCGNIAELCWEGDSQCATDIYLYGGSFETDDIANCKVYYRDDWTFISGTDHLGFRVVRSAF